MKTILLILIFCLTSTAALASSMLVTNGNNDGEGSFRAALASGANTIRISNSVSNIIITEPLVYTATQGLIIRGAGQTLDASSISSEDTVLSVMQGANLRISSLHIIGSANQVNQDPSNPRGGKGIFVQVPIERSGLVRVFLQDVSVTRVGHHGIHISDCSLGDSCGTGSGGGGDGSPASIFLSLDRVSINRVGFGRADADGVRVDDRGDGSIYFRALNSSFLNVGADGVELDEGNLGDVVADVRNSVFDSNGEYCNLVALFEGGPCDDDGDRDVDDGFDIDEAGSGTLFARVANSKVSNNFDEGLDFDAEDEGGAQVVISKVFAGNNQDEGFKLSEEGAGSVQVRMRDFTSVDNNGSREGVEIEEEGRGDLRVSVLGTNMIGGEDEVLKIEQQDGTGSLRVIDSQLSLDLSGVDLL